ncbi:MAG TPA: hypothetical protein VND64_36730 [Pirellulales bacterium]|nr:hypothetical protein [Pirellulales bacterium]
MNLVLEIPSELETELAAEAARIQLPLSEYVLRILATGRIPGPIPRNGAELIAYWHEAGLIGTRADIDDAPTHSRALRKQAETRERP